MNFNRSGIPLLVDLANKAQLNLNTSKFSSEIREAILIRCVENKFLELFSRGMMNGTVHTCVGQEFSAIAVMKNLGDGDWVTSNHRCHGHFIAKTKNWKGLIDELMGLESGVCRGVGSSQHLYADGFISNGPQGALLPVATGILLNKSISKESGIAVSFIGEGTLGEGIVYEAFNLASLYKLPQLFVCENNGYSQSTPQHEGVAGDISARPAAFGIKCFEANTWNLDLLFDKAREAVEYVRQGSPAFLTIHTYRLNSHSKGDDNRELEEIEFFKSRDLINHLFENIEWKAEFNKVQNEINSHVEASINSPRLKLENYAIDQLPRKVTARLHPLVNRKCRLSSALNDFYLTTLSKNALHIGEDICDPYGGAFKITKGLSTKYPNLVKNSSISESGIVGISIGYALMGREAYAEIMFGDFMTHIFDQLINNASKIFHMSSFKLNVPLRIRTAMGGKRGYGPTHSQSLEKFFLGIDNVCVLYQSSLIDPLILLNDLDAIKCPILILENKLDYGNQLWQGSDYFNTLIEDKQFGAISIAPKFSKPDVTFVTYGETARSIADNLELIFKSCDLIPELICITCMHPLDISLIKKHVRKTNNLIIIEDGSVDFGLGAELIAKLVEDHVIINKLIRIGASPVPIPSEIKLERELLPSIDNIIKSINKTFFKD